MKLSKVELLSKLSEGFTGVVDFYADWCQPCKALGPLLERIDSDFGGGKVYKINVDEEKDLAREYGISSIPALVYFKNGVKVNKTVGMTTKKIIMENLISNISGDTI